MMGTACTNCGGKVIGFEDSMSILVNQEKNGINELETKNIIKLWNSVTKYSNKKVSDESKFQTLKEKNAFMLKIEQMVKESSDCILILGTESIFKKFLHKNIVDLIKQSKSDLRILSDFNDKNNHVFQNIQLGKIKKIEDVNKENFCFIIKDSDEAVFFISNPGLKDKLAIWTDSKSFVITLRSLFNVLWNKSEHIDNSSSNSKFDVEITFDERIRELEQKKIILNYLQSVFKLTENEMANNREK